MAMARAKAEQDHDTDATLDETTSDTESSEEEWEWKMAMARAKAEKTDEVQRPSRPTKLAEGSGPTPRVSAREAAKPSRSLRPSLRTGSYIERKSVARPVGSREAKRALDKVATNARRRPARPAKGPDTVIDPKPLGAAARPSHKSSPLPSINKR
jgi:hypothetical protein